MAESPPAVERVGLWGGVLVAIYPPTVATLGWGSEIMLLLLLPALYLGRGWSQLARDEKRLMLGFVLPFVVMCLSLLNAEALRESGMELERYLRFALIVPLYLMLRRFGFLWGPHLALGAAVAAIAMFVQALYQVKWLGLPLAQGHYHKIVFGDLAIWWASVTVLLALMVPRAWGAKLALLAIAALAIYASILAQSRGGWLFLPLFPLILLWAWWPAFGKHRYLVLFAGVLLLAAGLFLALQSERMNAGLKQGVDEIAIFLQQPHAETSWGIRLNLWRNALLLLQEHPLLGSGVGDFQLEMQRMVADGRSLNPYVGKFGHAHSIYFDTLAKGGLAGFVAMTLGLLLLPLSYFIRGLRQAEPGWERFYALGGITMIAAFATFGLSEGLWSRNPFVNTYVFCMAICLAGMVNSRVTATADR